MKLFLSLVLLLVASAASAQSLSYGQKLPLNLSADGRPIISFFYIPYGDASYFQIGFEFPAKHLISQPGPITPSFMSFINAETQEVLLPWTTLPHHSKGVFPEAQAGFDFPLEVPQVDNIARSFKKIVILLSFKKDLSQASADFYIDLRQLCATNPALFLDIKTERSLCN